MGNLQVRFLEGWAPAMAPGYSTSSGYRPGFYCSGILVRKAGGATVTTADDIRQSLSAHVPVFWVYNDACPPSPGSVVPKRPRSPAASGIPYPGLAIRPVAARQRDLRALQGLQPE